MSFQRNKLQTVKKLIAFILDEHADRTERESMAMQAVRIIHENGLLKEEPVDEEQLPTFGSPPPQPEVAGGGPVRRPFDGLAAEISISGTAWCPVCKLRLPLGSVGMWSRGEIFHKRCYAAATSG